MNLFAFTRLLTGPTIFAALTATPGSLASAVPSGIISVNLASSATGDSAIDGIETFGAPALGTVVRQWNNTNAPLSGLLWSDGTASTVDFSYTRPAGSFATLTAGYRNTPLYYQAPHYLVTADDPGTSLTVTHLNQNFTYGYYVIVYLGGFATNTGASVTAGDTTYYFRPLSPAPDTFTFDDLVATTSTTPPTAAGEAPVAQYAVFGSLDSPLTADSFTARIDTLFSGGGAGIGGLQIVGAPAPATLTGTYYLDAVAGSDSNNGTSPATAWRTLDRLTTLIFGPGAQILFHRGDVFPGRFTLHGNGTADAPIVFDAYGDADDLPTLAADATDREVILIANGHDLEFRHLRITNNRPDSTAGDTYGISITARAGAGDLGHLYFQHLEFMDIVGSATDHECRALYARTTNTDGVAPYTRWVDFRIEDCTFSNIDGRAVQLHDLDDTLADHRKLGTPYCPTTGFVFQNNTGTDCYRNPLQINGTQGALIQHNSMDRTTLGSAFWPFNCEGTLVQFNEFSHIRNKESDGYVCHFDYNCVDTLMQYNFGYDVQGGLIEVIVQSGNGNFQENAVARYNVGIDVGYRANSAGIFLTGNIDGSRIYNNTILTTGSYPSYQAIRVKNWGDAWPQNTVLANNLFLALDSPSVFTDSGRLTLDGNVVSHNLYHGDIPTPAFDLHPVTGDPKLVNPAGISALDLKVTAGSAAIGAGLLIADNGGRDYFGFPVSASAAPTIGFHEYQGDTVIDSDADGIPDSWELLHGLDPATSADAGLDPDGDGFSNLDEYIAGTDPRDAHDHLSLELQPAPAGDQLLAIWSARPDRGYRLQNSTDLQHWQTTSGVTSPWPLTPPAGNAFYRLEVFPSLD